MIPIINPPECAILAVGAVEQRFVRSSGEIAIRDMMTLSLAWDHRAVDGVHAVRSLNEVSDTLRKAFLTTRAVVSDSAMRFIRLRTESPR